MSIPLPTCDSIVCDSIVSTPRVPLFSRREDFRACFIQLGNTFNVSFDLLKIIYLLVKQDQIDELNQCAMFHTNMLHFKHLSGCFGPGASRSSILDQPIYQEVCENHILTKDSIYSYLIPLNKHSEWVIQKSIVRGKYLLPPNDPNHNILGFLDCKEQVTMEINIIGSRFFGEDYFSDEELRWITIPASLRCKIDYLNNNDFHHIEEEYNDWIEMYGEERYPEFHII